MLLNLTVYCELVPRVFLFCMAALSALWNVVLWHQLISCPKIGCRCRRRCGQRYVVFADPTQIRAASALHNCRLRSVVFSRSRVGAAKKASRRPSGIVSSLSHNSIHSLETICYFHLLLNDSVCLVFGNDLQFLSPFLQPTSNFFLYFFGDDLQFCSLFFKLFAILLSLFKQFAIFLHFQRLAFFLLTIQNASLSGILTSHL